MTEEERNYYNAEVAKGRRSSEVLAETEHRRERKQKAAEAQVQERERPKHRTGNITRAVKKGLGGNKRGRKGKGGRKPRIEWAPKSSHPAKKHGKDPQIAAMGSGHALHQGSGMSMDNFFGGKKKGGFF